VFIFNGSGNQPRASFPKQSQFPEIAPNCHPYTKEPWYKPGITRLYRSIMLARDAGPARSRSTRMDAAR
jgi:hypothetical protein